MNYHGTFTNLSPQGLFRQLTNSSDRLCLHAFSHSLSWSIYIDQGKVIYATHSIEPFDRLERHLRRLSQQIPSLTSEIRIQLRMKFEPDWQPAFTPPDSNLLSQLPEYQAINWLITEKHLASTEAAILIQELVKEVIESFLLIKTGHYILTAPQEGMPKICKMDGGSIIDYCQAKLSCWYTLSPEISSPYQRPHLLVSSKFYDQTLPELQENLTNWMKGFSLRHLAVIIGQDEIELAQTLYPHIVKGSIILHQPDPPYDQLPKIGTEPTEPSQLPQYITEAFNRQLVTVGVALETTDLPEQPLITQEEVTIPQTLLEITTASDDNPQQSIISNNTESEPEKVTTATITLRKPYKIVSVDDSPTILKEINRFLADENISVVTVNDPVKAVMSIIRHKPDLILLDLSMAGIDGYELCRIIRNNSLFKEVPIIFVTGSKGIVDKVKAKVVGASGYLTKPFTRAELLKTIFMHLE
ncbi:MAG TPA: response regulator [Nostocaceae cyanobacterium]|nr:response regulator [Nostocaceae cyanobacterium]